MTDKNEVLELARKCGATDCGTETIFSKTAFVCPTVVRAPGTEFKFKTERLLAFAAALIEQAKAEYREDALRYRALRDQDIDGEDFPRSGLFIGKVPDNLCLTGVDADMAVDEAIRARSEK